MQNELSETLDYGPGVPQENLGKQAKRVCVRILILTGFVLLGGCGSRSETATVDGNLASSNQAVASVTPTPGMRGAEPATSASAMDARKVVEQYFALIAHHKYAEARQLWGNGGEDSGGTPAAFAATFKRYSQYRPRVGAPSEIRASNGRQYILVAADLYVKTKDTGAAADRTGTVMLRRSADPKEASADKREWRIWGVDIRKQH